MGMRVLGRLQWLGLTAGEDVLGVVWTSPGLSTSWVGCLERVLLEGGCCWGCASKGGGGLARVEGGWRER